MGAAGAAGCPAPEGHSKAAVSPRAGSVWWGALPPAPSSGGGVQHGGAGWEPVFSGARPVQLQVPAGLGPRLSRGGLRGGAGAGARCRLLLAESAGLGRARLPRCSRCPARGAWCPSHSWRAVRGTRPGALLTEPPSTRRAPAAAHGCGSGARHGDSSRGPCVLTCPCPCPLAVPSDLTPEECQELENIRRRKQELLADIQVRCSGLPCVLPHPRPSRTRWPLAQARPCVPSPLPRSWAQGQGRRRGCSAQDPQCPCRSRAGLGSGSCPRPLPRQPRSLQPVQAPLEFLGQKIGAAGSAGQGGPGTRDEQLLQGARHLPPR